MKKDTKPGFYEKQLEIIFSMSEKQRFMEGVDMIDFGYVVVRNSIISKNPGIDEPSLKLNIFKRLYPDEFTSDEVKNIYQSFINYFKENKNAGRIKK